MMTGSNAPSPQVPSSEPRNDPPAISQTEPAMGSAGGGAAEDPAGTDMPEGNPGEAIERASAGCGQLAAAQGQLSIRVGGADAAYTITLPADYDPVVPSPLIFGFHGRGRTHLQFQEVDASGIQSELGGRAIMVYLKSQGGDGWNFASEVEPNVAFFDALFAVVSNAYCVDLERVFAVGHSSGGYFSNILACRFADRLRGVASVAGASQESNCSGRVAAILIHGVRDSVVSFASGRAARDAYLARNQCSPMTQPGPSGPCVYHAGCAERFPVAWCEHSEPTYEDTNHGWPSFASRAVGEFLFSLAR
jgi:polyhydroxybutyrate depolymerase